MARQKIRPRSVLFVCLGNICRSPAAEGVLQHLVAERGLEEIIGVDSAGTGRYHIGESADPRMMGAANRRGYDLNSVARQVTRADYETFDLIVAMDRNNMMDLIERVPEQSHHVRLLTSFLPTDTPSDVPDPYYLGADGFETVLDLLEEACPEILDFLTER